MPILHSIIDLPSHADLTGTKGSLIKLHDTLKRSSVSFLLRQSGWQRVKSE